jgi:hypothetical protein
MPVNWVQLAASAAPLIAGVMAGKAGKKSANEAAGGARFAQLTPQMLQLVAQQMAQSNQNYTQQQERYAANQPLMDSIRSMALGMMPTRYQQAPAMGNARAMPNMTTPMPREAPMATGDILDDYTRRGGGQEKGQNGSHRFRGE